MRKLAVLRGKPQEVRTFWDSKFAFIVFKCIKNESISAIYINKLCSFF
jgi:hypothetical protein